MLKKLQHKLWFLIDLPFFVKQQKLNYGIELGAKAGRSMYFMLLFNRKLSLTGIDLWEIIEGSAYKDNNKNEIRCKTKLSNFSNRVNLIKGDAMEIADSFNDNSFDFIHYDLQTQLMQKSHQIMLEKWIPKIRKGGILIGRDFTDFREVFYNLGFKEENIKPCKIGNRTSKRLEYIVIS